LCATIIDGLNQLGSEFYCDQLVNNVSEKNYIQSDKILPYCKESDFILIFSNVDYKKRKQFIVENGLVKKTVYIDGSDNAYFEDPKAINIWPMVFKREIPIPFKFNANKIKPLRGFLENFVKNVKDLGKCLIFKKRAFALPFAAEKAYSRFYAEDIEKDINISCLLRGHFQERREINRFVKDLDMPNTIVGPVSKGQPGNGSQSAEKEEYYKILSRSKISISYPGNGFDTGRFWEILANRCLLFSSPVRIRMPYPLIEFKHFVPYNNLDQLKKRLHYYLEHNQEREEISLEGYRHIIKYHTSKKRTKYLLEILQQIQR